MGAAFIKVSCKDHENISSRTLLTIASCSSSDNVLQNARNFRRSFLGGEPRSTALLSSPDNCESHSSKISSLRSRSPLIAVHAPPRHPDVIRRRFLSSLEKYLGEVRLQRFGIGRLTAEADIAVGTDHIQTCTPSSIAVV